MLAHACIPLNVQLRRERHENATVEDHDKQFKELLGEISFSLKNGNSTLQDDWSFDYQNLFTSRIRGRPLHKHDKKTIIAILRTRTHWYRRLKPNMKLMVKHLVSDNNLLQLKEILHVADGVICQLLVSFPECLMVPDGDKVYSVTDQISNSIISSCLLNYSKVVKEIKDFRKKFRKAAFEKVRMSTSGYRSMSWVVPIITQYNDELAHRNSKEKMFRVCTFAQTRATGLAGKDMVKETVSKFIETVTTPTKFEPDQLLLDCIEEVADQFVWLADGTNPHFRASMSTSACRESSRKNEGKFGYLKKLVEQSIVPLPEFPTPDVPGGSLGTPLWWRAYRKARNGDTDVFDVNVAGIRENGKCRVVTSGSFWKDVLLQPFSHVTIEMAKSNPILAQGLSAGRLGWQFIQSIDNLDPDRGEILFEDDVVSFSFDFEKATDRPSHQSGRAVMTPILTRMGLEPEMVEVILNTWVGDKNLYHDGKYIGKMVRGIPMGDPLTKTNLSLSHPICSLYAKKTIGKRIVTVSTGNGDDGNHFVAGPHRIQYCLAFKHAASMLGYDLSEDDTFITEDWATYCEEVYRIPIDRFHTVRNGVRVKDSRISPYLDHPKGRLIIDTKKDRQDYSSDPKGKYTLLGKEMEYVRKDSNRGINFLYSVSSACQDICLGLRDRFEPLSLPREIFGVGKPPSNWSVGSWVNQLRNYRKWPRWVTIEVMKELIGERVPHFTTLRGVMRESQHFAGEGIIEVKALKDDDPLKKYRIIKADEWKKIPPGVLERLTNSGRLVRESKLSGYYLFHQRMMGMLSEQVDLFETIKSMSHDVKDVDDDEISRVVTIFRNKYMKAPWLLKSELTEDLYPSWIIDVMADADPLKVDLDLPYLRRFNRRPRSDTPYKRDMDRLETWFMDNYEEMLETGIWKDPPPQEQLSDDEIILSIIDNPRSVYDAYIIITDDIRLAKKAGRMFPHKMIGRISCHDWVYHSALERKFVDGFRSLVGITPLVLIDEGSLTTFMDTTGATYSMGVPVVDPLIRKWSEDVSRRPPAKQSDIYSRFRPRPEITEETVMSSIMITTPRNSPIFERIRAYREV
jgi:hypothetical protein